jgi:hypothetical protein
VGGDEGALVAPARQCRQLAGVDKLLEKMPVRFVHLDEHHGRIALRCFGDRHVLALHFLDP